MNRESVDQRLHRAWSVMRCLTTCHSASADSPSATSLSWWGEGLWPSLRQPASSRLPNPRRGLRDGMSQDKTRSPAEAGSIDNRRHAVHPLKRVADGESAGSRLRGIHRLRLEF